MLVWLEALDTAEEKDKFTRLYTLYRGRMMAAAMRLLRNREDAEDAVHQAFLSILRHFSKITEVDCPQTKAYVVIITERKALDILRARSRHPEAELDPEEPGLDVSLPEEGGLAAAMARLPARYREALLLHYLHGCDTGELAKLFGVKRGAVQKLLWRARDTLRRELEKEGEA